MLNNGEIYNYVKVVGIDHIDKVRRTRFYRCECLLCGKIFTARGDRIKSGHTKSCGCLQRLITKERATKHGLSKSQFYQAWLNMKARCFNKNSFKQKKNYSERGITVCSEWLNFTNFYKDMYDSYLRHVELYGEDTSLDRIDVNSSYCLENCKWSTFREQVNNKTDTYWITYNGKIQSLANWTEELNMNYSVLSARIRRGWTLQRALNTPSLTKQEQNLIPVQCVETQVIYSCAKEAAETNGIPLSTMRKIISGKVKNPKCEKHFVQVKGDG